MNKKKRQSKAISKYVLDNMCISTSREFKQLKRRQLREIVRAFDEYSLGCAECPGYCNWPCKLELVLKEMVKSHSCKEWGR